MGGGGKGGKGGGGQPQIPEFVKNAQRRVSEVGRQVFDISKPGLTAGSQQGLSLISTGGPGARVPILDQAVKAQQRGTNQAKAAVSAASNRAGTGGAFEKRMLNQLTMQGEQRARNIPIAQAVPLITGAIGTALGGSALGSRASAAGAQTLAAGLRAPKPSNAPGGADIASGLGSLFGKEGSFPNALKNLFGSKPAGSSFGYGAGGGSIGAGIRPPGA